MGRGIGRILAVCLLALACSDTDPQDGAEAASLRAIAEARADKLRAAIPAHVAELCSTHRTDETEHAEACFRAGRLLLEAVAQRIEESPPSWEQKILSIASICTREALALAQSEAPGRSEQALLVEGLERGPDCVDRQFALLEELARKVGDDS